jgi:hypothetical protein
MKEVPESYPNEPVEDVRDECGRKVARFNRRKGLLQVKPYRGGTVWIDLKKLMDAAPGKPDL